MIIIEGPDGAGKTTLINNLSSFFGLPVAPRVVRQDTTPMVNLREWVDTNLAQGFQRIIFDRHRLISEPIYGTIMPNKIVDHGFWERRWLKEAMTRFHDIRPLVIYCLPPLGTVVRNIVSDPNNNEVRPHIEQIYRAYVAQIVRSPDCFVWDYTKIGDVSGQHEILAGLLYKSVERVKEGRRDWWN
jgi:hypothetical protein